MINITDIPNDWLQQTASPEEFERLQLQRTASAFNLPLDKVIEKFHSRPFGNLTEQWRAFVSQLSDKDELWFFSSPEHMFAKKIGCQGYAIVRDGVILTTFVTLLT